MARPWIAVVVACIGCGDDVDQTPEGCDGSEIALADMSTPSGTTVVDLGPVELANPVVLFEADGGADYFASAPIELCIPADAVSLVVVADAEDAEPLIASWQGPEGFEQLDTSSFDTYFGGAVRPFIDRSTATLFPIQDGSDQTVGPHTATISAASASANVSIALRRGPSAADVLDLNVVFIDDNGLTDSERDALLEDTSSLTDPLRDAGIELGDFGFGFIANGFLSDFEVGEDYFAAVARSTVASVAGLPPVIEGAPTLFVVRKVRLGSGCFGGAASGVPGIPDHPLTPGMVLATEPARTSGGTVDPDLFWRLATHEVGHFLGLLHTSERDGQLHDTIDDTPECPLTRDSDNDGELSAAECSDLGADNVMFWISAQRGQRFTETQSLVMRRSAGLLRAR